jgi:N utilization substance protein B
VKNDRPKTMAERTARPRAAADKARQWIKVIEGKISGPDPAVELVGTPLSTALANAQAAETLAPGGPESEAAGAVAGHAAESADSGALDALPVSGGTPVSDPMILGTTAAEARPAAEAPPTEARPTEARPADARPADARPMEAHAHDADRWPEGRSKPQDSASKPRGTSPKPTGTSAKARHAFAATRSVARKLALQAIYRWLLNDAPWQDLVKEFGEAEDMPNADPKYFRELVEGVWASRKSLDEKLTELVDRPVEQLDPVEHSVLLIGLYELSAKLEVPYRVAINEAVGLTKRFGATDGHKFVNAVLDRAARTLRPGED